MRTAGQVKVVAGSTTRPDHGSDLVDAMAADEHAWV
jgi:hypothetical protein